MANRKSMRELRRAVGMTQKQAAGRIGVHPVTYSEYESGKTMPAADTLQRMAAVFGCSADDIEVGARRATRSGISCEQDSKASDRAGVSAAPKAVA